ncbi:MAG: BNR-4 repeat-containing protein [Sedimentisphaerales bacterium]
MKSDTDRSGTRRILALVILLPLAIQTSGSRAFSQNLKIDFTQWGGHVCEGWQGYFATQENLASFTEQSFSAFGTTIEIAPSWAPGAVNATTQMYDRGGDDGTDAEDFLRDWIGTDAREQGNPMTLTIAGLPAGTYLWTSWHHDPHDQTGLFDVTINDATGSQKTTDIDITSSWSDGISHLEDVCVFSTEVISNGQEPVKLTFDCHNSSGLVSTVFFLMNGFELDLIQFNSYIAFAPAPSNNSENVPLSAVLSWLAPTKYIPSAYDVYFGTDANSYDNPAYTSYANSFEPPYDLSYGTTYTWSVASHGPDTVYFGLPWRFTTIPNKALNPAPSCEEKDVSINTILTWTAAVSMTSQDVYFGTEPNPYDNPKYALYTDSFDPPGDLLCGTTYTWVIDTNDDGTMYPGDPWTFTTKFPVQAGDLVAGNMMLINDNAGWCWYQDEKIIYDPVGGNIITSTAAHSRGFGGAGGSRGNDVDVTTFNLDTGKRTRVLMADRAGDDHNMGSLWIRPDGRYLHVYAQHNGNDNSYYRISDYPNDGASWSEEFYYNWETISGLADGSNTTYSNLHYLSAERNGSGRLYNIVRQFQRSPNISYSDDWGLTWHYAGKLSVPYTGSSYSNGYYKFCSNGVNRIDFICTEHHPRDYNTSIYHGYIYDGKSWDSYGNLIDDNIFDEDAPGPEDFTPVFISSPEDRVNDSNEYHRAWTVELQIDSLGLPCLLFSTRYGTKVADNASGDADHRLFYARFDGSVWRYTELCKMGRGLHNNEQDYTGLGAIHPNDPNLIYVSTNFDPCDNTPLEHHEIFRGQTPDNGLTWNWTQITLNSTEDNIRPAIPTWDPNHTAVFWTRGEYPGQENFDMMLVGMIEQNDEHLGLITFVDANSLNTTCVNGSRFAPTGPDVFPGPKDDNWHQYSAYGNEGSFYTAGESSENAPVLKTTITPLEDGIYDMFAYFWCDPSEDWGLRAGFTPDDLLCFSKQSSQQAEASQFAGFVDVLEDEAALYRVYIGRRQITEYDSIDVYVDDYDGSFKNAPTRTTYEGIGIARVIPVKN